MMNTTSSFHVGQRVLFGRPNGEKTLGEVIKVNGKSLKVKTLEGRGSRDLVGQVWRVAAALCQPADGSAVPVPAPVPAGPDYSGLTEEQLLDKIDGLYASLSPENLTCDGELPMSQVRARAALLNRQLRACFKALGREVSEGECIQRFLARRSA